MRTTTRPAPSRSVAASTCSRSSMTAPGSGACGLVTVRDGLGVTTEVIGVQAERADAFARSWHGPERIVGERADTFAEGMATRVTFDLTFEILKRGLSDVVTLTEAALAEGVRLALRTTHNLAEGA